MFILSQYLKSVRPLMNDSEYESMIKLANEFENGIAVKLQRYLWLKSWYLFFIFYFSYNVMSHLNNIFIIT